MRTPLSVVATLSVAPPAYRSRVIRIVRSLPENENRQFTSFPKKSRRCDFNASLSLPGKQTFIVGLFRSQSGAKGHLLLEHKQMFTY